VAGRARNGTSRRAFARSVETSLGEVTPGTAVGLRLHREGRLRRRLGEWFGGDYALGDRIWRRCLHFAGAGVLLYYVLPPHVFILLTTEQLLFVALGAIVAVEALRLGAHLELPTIREREEGRVASYVFFATGLVLAVLVFPIPVAVAVALGTSFVDPLIGELRLRPWAGAGTLWGVPVAVYAALAAPSFWLLGHWNPFVALAAAGMAGLVAVGVERPRLPGYDDDLAMTLVPGLLLALLVWYAPGALG
jgi:dolichol kinase